MQANKSKNRQSDHLHLSAPLSLIRSRRAARWKRQRRFRLARRRRRRLRTDRNLQRRPLQQGGRGGSPRRYWRPGPFSLPKPFHSSIISRDEKSCLVVSPRGRLDIGAGDEEGCSDFAVFLQDYESLFALIFFVEGFVRLG